MNNILNFINRPEILTVFFLWTLIWKGLALWKAANKKQLIWFVMLLVINTMGILEIIYLVYLHRWDIDQGRTLKYLKKSFSKFNFV